MATRLANRRFGVLAVCVAATVVAVADWRLFAALSLMGTALAGAVWFCIFIDNHRRDTASHMTDADVDHEYRLFSLLDAPGMHGQPTPAAGQPG